MKLKPIISSLEDVPEQYRDLYEEQGDQFVLSVDDGTYKKKLSEFRTNNIDLRKKLESLTEKLSAFKDLDPEKIPEALEALAKVQEIEEKNLLDAGKVDEVVAQRTERMRSDFEGKIQKLQENNKSLHDQRDTYKKRLSDELINGTISRTVGEVGSLRKGALTDVLSRARSDWVVDDEGNLLPMRDGKVVYGADGKEPLSPKEWGESLFQSAPYLFEPSSGGGAAGSGKGNGVMSGRVSWGDQDAINHSIEAIAAGKVVVDSQ